MKTSSSSIVLLARITRWATTAALAVGAASWAWGSLTWFNHTGVQGGLVPTGASANPLFAWLLGSLGLAVTGYGLVRIVQLMRIYESGVVFDARASSLLSGFAAAIFLREVIDVLSPTLLSIAMHLDDGRTPVTFTVGSSQAHVLFMTLVFLLIARIMAAGHRLADDNAKII